MRHSLAVWRELLKEKFILFLDPERKGSKVRGNGLYGLHRQASSWHLTLPGGYLIPSFQLSADLRERVAGWIFES